MSHSVQIIHLYYLTHSSANIIKAAAMILVLYICVRCWLLTVGSWIMLYILNSDKNNCCYNLSNLTSFPQNSKIYILSEISCHFVMFVSAWVKSRDSWVNSKQLIQSTIATLCSYHFTVSVCIDRVFCCTQMAFIVQHLH